MQKSILVIDDDEDDLFFLKDAFMETGFQFTVYSATNGNLGLVLLSQLKHSPPSLVILDSKIAVMDRFKLLGKIKKDYNIPVLIYTTTFTDALIEDAKAKGAFDCLKKCSSLDEHKEAVRKIAAIIN
jgi:CheY-like chemotaxis protein